MAGLDPLFFPSSVAVIGASDRPLTIGHRIVHNLLDNGFTGSVYPVNPKGGRILDLEVHKSINEVPVQVDLAHLIVRNTFVPSVLEDCARAGVKVAIVNTSGFRETGDDGAALEEQVKEVAKKTGIRVFGPNCQGVMNSDSGVSLYSNFTFATMRPGHISIVCQGGGVAEVINNHFGMRGIGQRFYASNGNACDISIAEILEYYGNDPLTRVIVLHLESISDPEDFLARVQPVARLKPILALKSGTTAEGARAVASHTGALMAGDTLTNALFDACGILRFSSLAALCEAAEAFACQPIPKGNRIGMVTNAGSPAIIVTDEAIKAGLQVPPLALASAQHLRSNLQAIASVANPIDMMATASGEEFAAALDALLSDQGIDAVVVCFMTPFFVDTSSIAAAIADRARTTDTTLVAVAMTDPDGKEEWRETVDRIRQAGLPVYYFPESAASALAAMDRYRRLKERAAGTLPVFDIEQLKAEAALATEVGADGFLPPTAVHDVLTVWGLPVAGEERGRSRDDVVAAAERIGYPVVIKAEAPSLVHKTESGAVVLDLRDQAAVEQTWDELEERLSAIPDRHYMIQPYLSGGLEVIIGGARADGAATVMFGLGGIHVELFEDVVFKLAPMTDERAREMLSGIRSAPLLDGFRGRPGVDRAALEDILLRVSQMLVAHPEISELDLNPVLAFEPGKGATIVDARIRVSPKNGR